jgi:type III restriction enzyme
VFRNLWENIRKACRRRGAVLESGTRPAQPADPLQTALKPSTGITKKTFELVAGRGHQGAAVLHRGVQQHLDVQAGLRLHLRLPPQNDDGSSTLENGRLPLFRNFDDSTATRCPPRTLLIDSEQLKSGDALDDSFHDAGRP